MRTLIIKRIFFITGLIVFFFLFNNYINAQTCTCDGTVPTYTVNLSANSDTTWTTTGTRQGLCCTATSPSQCIKFIVTVSAQSSQVGFNVTNPSPPGGAFYQVDCGPQISLGTPLCLSGVTSFCITYCKSGGDAPNYTISATKGYSVSPDTTVRIGCVDTLSVSGLTGVTWTSVYPGAQGAYDSYLSCTSGCNSTYITPQAGAPAYIDYQVCGVVTGCTSGTYCDTIRVYVSPGLIVSVTPPAPTVCSSGSDTTVVLTANPSGGAPPYSYSWSTTETTQSITVGAGTYTVSVTDISSCPPVTSTVTVTLVTTPPAPTAGNNGPLCVGQTLNLTASNEPGATYSWTGPNGFTSSLQNPSILNVTTADAGVFSVTVTVNGCTSVAGKTGGKLFKN